MDDQEELVFESDADPLAQTAEPGYALTRYIGRAWLDRAQQKRAAEPDLFEHVAGDARLQGLDVSCDVGKFGHGTSIIERMHTFRILLGGWLIGGAAIVLLSIGHVVARPAPVGPAVEAMAIPRTQDQLNPTGVMIPVRGISSAQLRDTFTHARGGGSRSHGAMDIMAPRGTEVLAAVDGTIKKLFNSKAGGITIYQFDAKEELVYYYAHLDRYADGIS